MTLIPYKSWVRHKNGDFERGRVIAVWDGKVKVQWLEAGRAIVAGTSLWFDPSDLEEAQSYSMRGDRD